VNKKKRRKKEVNMGKFAAFALAAVALCAVAFAQSQTCGSGVQWKLEESVLTVYAEDVTPLQSRCDVPDEDIPNVKTIVFENISRIEDYTNGMFRDYFGLEEIKLCEDMTYIGNNAFTGCKALKTMDITHIETIGINAFYGCAALEEVKFGENLTTIQSSAFSKCSSLKSLNMPNITQINSYAFEGCTALQTVTFGELLTSVGQYAFSGCTGLTEINFAAEGENLQNVQINEYAFTGCTALETLELPGNVRTVYYYAFYGCSHLTTVTIRGDVSGYSARDIFLQLSQVNDCDCNR